VAKVWAGSGSSGGESAAKETRRDEHFERKRFGTHQVYEAALPILQIDKNTLKKLNSVRVGKTPNEFFLFDL
jgi:hypothetical protein